MEVGRRSLAGALLAALLAGCSVFKPAADDDAQGASAKHVDETRARYQLEVTAPKALKRLLEENLDLARFRDAPAGETLNNDELDRLVSAAPEQARALLATEGYFSPDVKAEQRAGAALPLVAVTVEPGPRTLVETFTLKVQGPLQQRAEGGDADARRLLGRLNEEWPLQPGEPFRQGTWAAAKNATLSRLHANGYPTASWLDTDARVRRQEQRADLDATAQSGPLFFMGPLTIEGLQRYDERAVRNLAPFATGTPYSEQLLLDFQERLAKSGLFDGGVAEIDTDPAKAAATPVTLRVTEKPLQQATTGIGYDSNTGTRVTLEHTHRQPFGLRWTAVNKFEFGPLRKAWEFDYRSYPKSGFRRNLVAGEVERWSGPDEERYAGRLRLGRAWEDPRLERQVYAEYNNTRVKTPTLGEARAQSLTAHLDWTRRAVDSLLLPSTGTALLLQSALGYARSSTADNGPLARLYGRGFWFVPFAQTWNATLRLEAGQVFARDAVGVPDTLLFRAGGDDSVRGYEYRSLGPRVNGEITSGRSLLTASAEVARPVAERFPQLWGAAFVDAGHAAARFADIKPVVGAGVGVRYRSPIGPLKVDMAYGFDDRKWRMHLAAGVSF
jgi:translocation and assembly module TamA